MELLICFVPMVFIILFYENKIKDLEKTIKDLSNTSQAKEVKKDFNPGC